MVEIHPIYQRLAELWTLNKRRQLDVLEMADLQHCLAVNAKMCWDMACMENMSLLAYETGDVEWQHEICAKIDAQELGKPKRKKRGA